MRPLSTLSTSPLPVRLCQCHCPTPPPRPPLPPLPAPLPLPNKCHHTDRTVTPSPTHWVLHPHRQHGLNEEEHCTKSAPRTVTRVFALTAETAAIIVGFHQSHLTWWGFKPVTNNYQSFLSETSTSVPVTTEGGGDRTKD